jgi:hypothetical protein
VKISENRSFHLVSIKGYLVSSNPNGPTNSCKHQRIEILSTRSECIKPSPGLPKGRWTPVSPQHKTQSTPHHSCRRTRIEKMISILQLVTERKSRIPTPIPFLQIIPSQDYILHHLPQEYFDFEG